MLPLKNRVHVSGRLSKDLIKTLNPFCVIRCPTAFQSAYPIYFYRHAQSIKRRTLCGTSTDSPQRAFISIFIFATLARINVFNQIIFL